MKRTLVLAISLIAVCVQLSAYDFMVDKLCYNINADGESVTVTYQNNSSPRYTDLSGELIIPESVKYEGVDYPVTGINYWAFEGCSELSSVSIPCSVTSVGDFAFSNCVKLESVYWNANLDNSASFGESGPFANSTSITSFIFGDDVKIIPSGLCYGLTGLTSLSIPSSVVFVGYRAFGECYNVKSVFWDTNSVATDIPSYYEMSPIESLANAEEFVFGSHVKSIQNRLCQKFSIKSVHIPSSVEFIGDGAFDACNQLEIVSTDNIRSWININFAGENSNPASISKSLYIRSKNVETNSYDYSKVTDLTIDDSVFRINNNAFYNNLGLQTVTFDKFCGSGDKDAFYNCENISRIDITDLTRWLEISFEGMNPLYYAGHLYLNGDEIKELVIPESIEEIGRSAFRGCKGLTSITILDNVKTIGLYAFDSCSNVASLSIGDGVETILVNAFCACEGITELKLGNSVNNIGYASFYYCNKLKTIDIPESVVTIGSYAFCNDLDIESVTNHSKAPQVVDGTVFCKWMTAGPTPWWRDLSGIKLYVPEESLDLYKVAPVWEEFDVQAIGGVEGVEADDETKTVAGYYNLQGVRIDNPERGQVSIVRYTDGTAAKVVVR